jgi:hypothetical protein
VPSLGRRFGFGTTRGIETAAHLDSAGAPRDLLQESPDGRALET